MRFRTSLTGILTALVAVPMLGSAPEAQTAKPYGAATPQEAVAALKKAVEANDFAGTVPLIAPAAVKDLASETVAGVLMLLAFADPDDPMPGSPAPSKTELDARRKRYKAAVGVVGQTLKPYGLDSLIGKPPLSPETQKSIDTALAKADNVALITSLFATVEKIGPSLGVGPDQKPKPIVKVGNVTGYRITGDTATAQDDGLRVDFVRIGGRWYITPPGTSSAPGQPPGTQGGTAQGRQGGSGRATASGNQPEVVAGGIQVSRVVMTGDDFSARPFNAENGTKLALWIRMPANQGLIEIDEDASLLQRFADDKGTNLGGRLESFPSEFKDGSGGVIEIESTAVPAAGATSLIADGTLALSVATGTRKTRAANVRLQNEAKFTLDKTPIVLSDVEAATDAVQFTLKLPRQVMTTIRNVVFLDAKNQPLEGRTTGRGYMNDNAEMSFSVTTTARTVTLEFELWQGLRTIKVPFAVKAGLGLN